MKDKKRNSVFIVWSFPKTRSREICSKFRLKLYGINSPPIIPAVFRYLICSVKMFFFLFKEKPDFIFIQLPPVFAGLIGYIHTVIFGGKILLDVHSGEIVDKKWFIFQPLRQFLFKRAFIIFTHNSSNYENIKNWYTGLNLLILHDPVPIPPKISETRFCRKCREVVIVSSLGEDEPYMECLEAAEILAREENDWKIVFTGDYKLLGNIFKPENVIFTGFVEYRKYWSILKGSDVLVSFNKRKGVITCGLWEGFALEKPIVTNNSYILKKVFGNSCVYTDPEPSAIADAIKVAYENSANLKEKVKMRKAYLENEWKKTFNKIKKNMKQNAS